MNDTELVKALRKWADVLKTNHDGFNPEWQAMYHAATRIEQLARDNNTLRNELCLKCGLYKTAHEGSCDGCRWHKKGE